MNRDEAIATIKAELKRRSGKAWSVTGGRGTAWGWITIDAPPSQRTWHFVPKASNPGQLPGAEWDEVDDPSKPFGHTGPFLRHKLSQLLSLSDVHHQGVKIPSSNAHYEEFIARAKGIKPERLAEQYWD